MAVPETAVDKNNQSVADEDKIGFPGKIGPIEPKAIPSSMHRLPNLDFRGRIPGVDLRHSPAARGAVHGVDHGQEIKATEGSRGSRLAETGLPRRQLRARCTFRGAFGSLLQD